MPLVLLLRRGAWFRLQAHHQSLGLDGKDYGVSAYQDESGEEDHHHEEHSDGVEPQIVVNSSEKGAPSTRRLLPAASLQSAFSLDVHLRGSAE